MSETIRAYQEWVEYEDGYDEWEWKGLGWETADGMDVDENLYELIEVVDEDKHYHPIEALFKLR